MNFRGILSKSSLKSSSSSGKSLSPTEEIPRLQSEVESLKQTIESLKISVESRDAAIGTLAREKEKLYVELKSAQRTNRNLHQQLVDERDMHAKEKDYFIDKIKRLSKGNAIEHFNKQDSDHESQGKCSTMKSSYTEEVKAKDEIIYNICSKYLKIKTSKQLLQKKLEKLQLQSQKICENVIMLLHENRHSLDNLLNKLLKASTTTPNSKKYLKLLKINANLHYENTQLKVCLSVNDFSKELDEENSERENQTSASPTKFSKSEDKSHMNSATPKTTVHDNHPIYSNLYKLLKYEKRNKFNTVHAEFSPYFRRKKYYGSEPCLAK